MTLTLKDATLPLDFQRVGELIVDGWSDDNFWRAIQHEATREDAVAWMRDLGAVLFSKPYYHFYFLVDEQNGYGAAPFPSYERTSDKSLPTARLSHSPGYRYFRPPRFILVTLRLTMGRGPRTSASRTRRMP